MDAFGLALGREYGLGSSVVNDSRKKSYVLMYRCAEFLGRADSAWRNIATDVWLTEEYQAERSRYLEWENEMVMAGKLPKLEKSPSGFDLVEWDRQRSLPD